MHTNNWRPLNARDAESYEKKLKKNFKKNIKNIYIYIVAPYGLAEFFVGKSQCFGTSRTHLY